MATIDSGTHEVMITGYNSDGSYEYVDPATGQYNHVSPGSFGDVTEIKSMKY